MCPVVERSLANALEVHIPLLSRLPSSVRQGTHRISKTKSHQDTRAREAICVLAKSSRRLEIQSLRLIIGDDPSYLAHSGTFISE